MGYPDFGIVTVVTYIHGIKTIQSNTVTEQINPGTEPWIGSGRQLMKSVKQKQEGVNEVLDAINSIDFPVMIGSFLFFFLFGYLLYAALFAAIGVSRRQRSRHPAIHASDHDSTDFCHRHGTVYHPGTDRARMAFWLSIIPSHFTGDHDDQNPFRGSIFGSRPVNGAC